MSLVQLTLRPPPHVDFVSGYPGIPPNGSDRPQAAVKGALEVRVPTQGVKAQWVKVELRKVEILPGGGAGNTFYDIVGPGTVTLWTSGGAEYEVLHARDFPFSIRIPEAVPPSLQLEQRAGIQYELVATVCTKGKRSFFRKRKHALTTTLASVIIDKHDLHSTWPVYCQPESRHVTQDQMKLTVDRNQSCYGPGDRMAVTATIKSEATHTVMLRSFEISLKETITYRGHIYVAGKKGEASTKSAVVSENKFQVNTPMYGGMQATQDLFCMLSATHTNTTLTAARHIDITYVLVVKAHLGAGLPLVIELPVIISNWQRAVSLEAMRRIGPAPGLSVIPGPGPGGVNPFTREPITHVEPIKDRPSLNSPSLNQNRTGIDSYGTSNQNSYNTYPASTAGISRVEDSGRRPTHQVTDSQTSMQSMRDADEFGLSMPGVAKATVGTGKRPPSASSRSPQTHRFTITNALPLEIPEEPQPSQHQRKGSDVNSNAWLSASEEKLRYEQARARVELVQGGTASPQQSSAPPVVTSVTPPPQQKPPSRNSPWPTAEEEKLRLFQNAQAAVARTQGHGSVPASIDPSQVSSTSKPPSAAAMMYSQAVSAMKNETARQQSPSLSAMTRAQTSTPPPGKPPKAPGYMTAEEEKLAVRRYEEAKKAVDLTQNPGYYDEPAGTSISGLVPYDSLYPSGPSGSAAQTMVVPPPANDLPPPFDSAPLTAPQQLSEKERLRRLYEAQDAAALSSQTTTPSRVASPAQHALSRQGSAAVAPPTPLQATNHHDSSPPPFSGGPFINATAEKEALRKRFEAQDAATMSDYQTVTPPQTPPRSTSATAFSSLRSRPAPLPPPAVASGSGQRILTAAEEKALLRARYEAQDVAAASGGGPPPPMYVNGYTNGRNSVASSGAVPSMTSPLSYATASPSIASPPPLMPRPPQEYIQETQEEDARVSRMTMNGIPPTEDELENGPRADVVRALSTKVLAGNVVPPLPPKPLGE